jgi:hypothetical protein
VWDAQDDKNQIGHRWVEAKGRADQLEAENQRLVDELREERREHQMTDGLLKSARAAALEIEGVAKAVREWR